MFFFKKFQVFILLIFLFFSIVSILNAKTIRYLGAPTLNPFIRNAAKTYKHASFKIITRPFTHEISIIDILDRIDIIGVADGVNPELILLGAKKYLIGKDAIGVWVNKTNPISTLSFHQLKEIYTGKVTHWHTFGPYDKPIHIYIVDSESPIRLAFQKIILKESEFNEQSLQVVKPGATVLKKIGNDPGGIGFLSLSTAVGHKSQPVIKTILVNGQKASNQNFNYPVTRPLYLVTFAEAWEKEKKFIDWVLSEQGQKIVKKFFIGHSSEPLDSAE